MSNLSIECYDGAHLVTVYIAVALLLFYIFAVPGIIAYITKRLRAKLYTTKPVETFFAAALLPTTTNPPLIYSHFCYRSGLMKFP